jgi:hypothetical protein
MGEARNIYNAACAQIAAALAQEGFEYRPSKHTLVCRDDDLTREIAFQSSFRNFALPEQGIQCPSASCLIVSVSGRDRGVWQRNAHRPHRGSLQDVQAVACIAENSP